MARYRKKPVVIEAVQIRLNLAGPMYDGGWLSSNPFSACVMRRPHLFSRKRPMIKTLEGWLTVSPGDWIIKGVKGEIYPCKPDIFAETYEAVDG